MNDRYHRFFTGLTGASSKNLMRARVQGRIAHCLREKGADGGGLRTRRESEASGAVSLSSLDPGGLGALQRCGRYRRVNHGGRK